MTFQEKTRDYIFALSKAFLDLYAWPVKRILLYKQQVHLDLLYQTSLESNLSSP